MPMRMRSSLSEEFSRWVAQKWPASALAARPVEPADDHDGDAVELAHDGIGRGGALIGQRPDRRLQHAAGRILLAQIALERLEPRHADRDVGQPFAPRSAERVGDDDAQIVARQGAEAVAQPARGTVGVRGEETGRVGVDVGLVHARVRADPALVRLDDQHALVAPDYSTALAEYDFDQPRVATELLGHR